MPKKTVLFDLNHNEMLNIHEDEFSEFLELLRSLNLKIKTNENKNITDKLLQNIADGIHPVRVFREFQGLSQAKLASDIGITRQYLHQIEMKQRKGNVQVLKKIADLLDVPLELLITDSED